jgi:hypothetical protein
MENTFEHAREYLQNFLKTSSQGIDTGSVIKLMTDWAGHFSVDGIKDQGKAALSALEAEFKAKIALLEQTLVQKDASHQEAVNALQTRLTAANAVIESKIVADQVEPEKPSPKKVKA